MEIEYCYEEGNIFEYHNRFCISKGNGKIMDEYRCEHKIDSGLQNDIEFVNINVPEKKQVEFVVNSISECDVWFITNILPSFVAKYKDVYSSEINHMLQNIITKKLILIKTSQISNLVNTAEPINNTKTKQIYKDCNTDNLHNIIRILYLV